MGASHGGYKRTRAYDNSSFDFIDLAYAECRIRETHRFRLSHLYYATDYEICKSISPDGMAGGPLPSRQ